MSCRLVNSNGYTLWIQDWHFGGVTGTVIYLRERNPRVIDPCTLTLSTPTLKECRTYNFAGLSLLQRKRLRLWMSSYSSDEISLPSTKNRPRFPLSTPLSRLSNNPPEVTCKSYSTPCSTKVETGVYCGPRSRHLLLPRHIWSTLDEIIPIIFTPS